MGYYMSQVDQRFRIDKENKEAALDAIKALKAESRYDWVDEEEYTTAEELEGGLLAWRWRADLDKDGNVVGIQFDGEKLGDDEVLMRAIAPFVKHGSFIEMVGEDQDWWRWSFRNGKAYAAEPTVIWPGQEDEATQSL
jgi:hypothetical protein|tara:strand:+ start:507 stop:920 length:414 start_codon:yes stop_codon:yes gene_type:complete